ncbi:MAG TPA: DUF898 family protein, partial [Bdellovibrionales bacterium]|nr:DUF898 family protein [Bdellovibrionales bacterium]
TPFRFRGDVKAFFMIYYAAAGFYLIAICLGLGAVFAFRGMATAGAGVMVAFIYGGLLFAVAWIRGREANEVGNFTSLGPIKFECKIDPYVLFGLYLTNLIACALTLGLAFPWAMVRLAEYRASRMRVLATPSGLEQFLQGEMAAIGPAADAAADFWDIDVGF